MSHTDFFLILYLQFIWLFVSILEADPFMSRMPVILLFDNVNWTPTMCQALGQAQCIQRREIFKNKLQILFVNYYRDKCYEGETPMVKAHKANWQGGEGQWG